LALSMTSASVMPGRRIVWFLKVGTSLTGLTLNRRGVSTRFPGAVDLIQVL
jgi:hypothetical protein